MVDNKQTGMTSALAAILSLVLMGIVLLFSERWHPALVFVAALATLIIAARGFVLAKRTDGVIATIAFVVTGLAMLWGAWTCFNAVLILI